MQHRLLRTFLCVIAIGFSVAPARPAMAQSRESAPVGERYWIELTGGWWQPDLTGIIASDRLGLIGSAIDFVTDLGFDTSRNGDVRLVLRPARKHKFRFQYTPTDFAGDSVLTRDISFAGQVYPVSLPIQSLLTWTVVRFGYEWDFFYKPRGFVGLLLDVRKTDLTAAIESIVASGEVIGRAPFPALGLVARVHPTRRLAIGFEISGLKLTDLSPEHAFTMSDLEFSATYNLSRFAGLTGGWRRMNTSLVFESDRGELDFRGIWFGAVVRY
jgi:hypothetical protein